MGRQINFWMTIEDEEEFVDILRKENVLWTYYSIKFNESPVLYELGDLKIKNERQHLVIIRRKDKDLLEFEHISKSSFERPEDLRDDFEPWTMVGCAASPCFQWNTCSREDVIIKRGRIYLPTDWYDAKNNQIHQKEPELIKWFDQLTAKLRKKGEKHEYNGQYIMPHANRLLKAKKIELTS